MSSVIQGSVILTASSCCSVHGEGFEQNSTTITRLPLLKQCHSRLGYFDSKGSIVNMISSPLTLSSNSGKYSVSVYGKSVNENCFFQALSFFRVEKRARKIFCPANDNNYRTGVDNSILAIEKKKLKSLLKDLSREESLLIQFISWDIDLSERVLRVLCKLKRSDFVHNLHLSPYYDCPQPIGFKATISAPFMHAFALQALNNHLQPGNRVLDVGSGSGYLTAAFGILVSPNGKSIGVDHIQELVHTSQQNVSRSYAAPLLENGVIEFHCADGRMGWNENAPYDAIHVGAASEVIPKELIRQLAPGGRLVIPVGTERQRMWIVDKKLDGSVVSQDKIEVCFIPLTDEGKQRAD